MSTENNAQKKREREERKRTNARDIHRNTALIELMRRDPLSERLTGLIVQLYKGFTDDPAVQSTHQLDGNSLPLIKQLYGARPVGDVRASLKAALTDCCETLCRKYHVPSIYVCDEVLIEDLKADIVIELCEEHNLPSLRALDSTMIAALQEQFSLAFEAQASTCWINRGGFRTLKHKLNWVPAGSMELVIDTHRIYCVTLEEQPPPPDELPMLTATVDLSKVTSNDLERLAWEFKSVVTKALKSRPTNRVSDPQNAADQALSYDLNCTPPIVPTDVSPTLTVTLDCSLVNQRSLRKLEDKFKAILREALVHLPEDQFEHKLFRWEEFVRDLRRYDWHQKYGFSFRYIAFLERNARNIARREGKEVEEPLDPPSCLTPKKVGSPIPEEDSVERGMKKIYLAIYRHPYPVSRRKSDTALSDMAKYNCPHHEQNDCPETCSYLMRRMREIAPTLPTDDTVADRTIQYLEGVFYSLPDENYMDYDEYDLM
jgi:hypothetical protein